MLIEKPRCNFKNCRYCFDSNCYSADKYENCKVTDLHSEIAKLTVDLDNAKAEVAREIIKDLVDFVDKKERQELIFCKSIWYVESDDLTDFIAELKKKYTEGET